MLRASVLTLHTLFIFALEKEQTMLTIVPRVNSGLELNLEATKEIGYRKIFSAIVISKFNIPKMIKLILGNIS